MATTKHDRVCFEKQVLWQNVVSISHRVEWEKRRENTYQAPIHETHVYRNRHQHGFTEEYNPRLCKNIFRTCTKTNRLGFDRRNPSRIASLFPFANGLVLEDNRMIRLIDGEDNQDRQDASKNQACPKQPSRMRKRKISPISWQENELSISLPPTCSRNTNEATDGGTKGRSGEWADSEQGDSISPSDRIPDVADHRTRKNERRGSKASSKESEDEDRSGVIGESTSDLESSVDDKGCNKDWASTIHF